MRFFAIFRPKPRSSKSVATLYVSDCDSEAAVRAKLHELCEKSDYTLKIVSWLRSVTMAPVIEQFEQVAQPRAFAQLMGVAVLRGYRRVAEATGDDAPAQQAYAHLPAWEPLVNCFQEVILEILREVEQLGEEAARAAEG